MAGIMHVMYDWSLMNSFSCQGAEWLNNIYSCRPLFDRLVKNVAIHLSRSMETLHSVNHCSRYDVCP
jgi:hypothetical protein